LSGQFPAAANDAHVDEPRGLWFPSCAPDLAVVGVIVLLLLLASVLLGMYEPAPRAEWFSMWGIAK
jgi:ABC-type multidrug transport system permease subunit